MKLNPMRACLFLLLAASTAHPAEKAVQPAGIYASIDTRLAHQTIQSLQRSNAKERSGLIKEITNAPASYAPPVLYLVSSILFEEGKKDDAMFWFYAGQLRGRIDANICADKSARQAIAVLNERFGTPINRYAFRDVAGLTNTVEKVLKWEQKTECKYDRRWINLHGMGAFIADTKAPLSAPKEEWEKIRKTTRDDYRSSFYEAIKTLGERKL
jgi:hypothetical protein